MKALRSTTFAAVLLAALCAAGGPSFGQEEHTAPGPTAGGGSEMWSRFYSGSLIRTGAFPGKLVCLRCDLKPGPEAMKLCREKGHRHALSMEGGWMVHPLLAGTKEVADRINSAELHDKEVVVHGKYYDSGAILVGSIEEKQ